MSSLYDAALLSAAANTTWRGLPEAPTHRASVRSRLCADDLTVALTIEGGTIVGLGWTGEACAVCRAAAHVLCEQLRSQPLAAVDDASDLLARALADDDVPAPLAMFRAVHPHPSRHGCATLPLRAIQQALGDVTPPEPPTPTPVATLEARTAWQAAMQYRQAGLDAVLATLVSVEGSSPCPIGSHMVVAESGAFWGSVSGGCVESAVVQAGLMMLRERSPAALLDYQISNSQAGAVGLPCGGQIRVHLTLAPSTSVLARAHSAPSEALAQLHLNSGAVSLLDGPPRALTSDQRAALSQREGVLAEADGEPVFIEPLGPEPALVLVGGTHVAQKLAQLALTVGLRVVLVEPRAGFASPERFPGVELISAAPEQCLPSLLGAEASVVTLTHTAALDDPSLIAALASDARYVGALGSRKTQAARLQRLRDQGLPEAQLARIHGPAGLPIGGLGAGEIALSILAEVIAARRRPTVARIGALVLAAGSSRRAGPVNKLLQPLDGRPLVRHSVKAVLDAGVDDVVVVLGHDAERVQEALRDLPVQFVHNAAHSEGMGRSIAVGVEAIEPLGVSATFVVLGDMPYVRAADLQSLMHAHRPSTQHLVVAPVADDGSTRRRGNPVLWPRRLFPELKALRGDTGGKPIIAAAPGIVLPVPIAHTGVLRDVDHVLGE